MKGIYVITIAFLASCVCTAYKTQQFIQETGPFDNIVRECPARDPINTTIHLAHENDCTKFYKCLAGRRTEQLCPLMWEDDPVKRLHFNRALQVCDWPWLAGCEDCPEPDKNGNRPPDFWVADPNSRDCRGYIICRSDGGRQSGICPSDKCFSRTCQACVRYPEGGSCSGSITPPTTETTETTETTKITKPPPCINNDRRAHECDCSKYYQCKNSIEEYVYQCENGLHFSRTKKECMSPEDAGCKLLPKINIKKN